MSWQIFEEVVCIHDHPINDIHRNLIMNGYIFPEKGKTYTIRGFNSEGGILLREIINPLLRIKLTNKWIEVAFHSAYFTKQKEDTIELSEVLVDENGIVQEELIKS